MALGKLQVIFGRNVRAYRESLGVSQEQFAADSNMHRTYLGAIERGERNVTFQTFEYYCTLWEQDPLDMLSPNYDRWGNPEVSEPGQQ